MSDIQPDQTVTTPISSEPVPALSAEAPSSPDAPLQSDSPAPPTAPSLNPDALTAEPLTDAPSLENSPSALLPSLSDSNYPASDSQSLPLLQVIEALLFATDTPLSPGKLAEIVGLDSTKPIKLIVDELNQSYQNRPGGGVAYRIEERAGGYQLLTLPQYAEYIHRLVRKKDEGRLTPASLETLAIVAYKQPIIRADIEAIRGVACGEVLRSLMEHNMVKIVGRAELVGRPMLYGTTRYFLEVFGLPNLKDLPKSDSLKEPK